MLGRPRLGPLGAMLLCAVGMLTVAVTADGQDDPFGPNGDPPGPFGDAKDADPFGCPADPVVHQLRAEVLRRRQLAASHRTTARALIENELEQATADHILLDDALTLFAAPPSGEELSRIVSAFARLSWLLTREPPVREYLDRLEHHSKTRRDPVAERFRQLRQSHSQVVETPWPLDWRDRREASLQFAECLLRTLAGEDMGTRWRALPVDARGRTAFYRAAHLLACRESTAARLDYEFVGPLLSGGFWQDRIRWEAEGLIVLLNRQVPENEERRSELRKWLLEALQEKGGEIGRLGFDLTMPLSRLYRVARPSAPESRLLLETMLRNAAPQVFDRFANQAGISQQRRQQLFLAKPVRLPDGDRDLNACLDALASQVALTVWIDPRVRSVGDHRTGRSP